MKLRIRSACDSSRPVELRLSKMSCGLSWSRLSEMSTITSFARPLQSAGSSSLASATRSLKNSKLASTRMEWSFGLACPSSRATSDALSVCESSSL